MRLVVDMGEILYGVVGGSALPGLVSGGVFLEKQPDDSKSEYIVINTIVLSEGPLDLGAANVNIHVPDMEISIGGRTQKAPNLARIKALGAVAIPLLKRGIGGGYSFGIENQNLIAEPELDSHYLNLVIRFVFYNN